MGASDNILIALEIMGKGMAGIFTATLLVIAVVWLLAKTTAGITAGTTAKNTAGIAAETAEQSSSRIKK